jgi:hypothetical protein
LSTNGEPRSRFLIGSDEHKELFCRTFSETHETYDPIELPWPLLDEMSLSRLRGLPFWNMALQAETNAGAMVSGFAATIADPRIRAAVELQGFEEDRHGRLIETMVKRYDLGATKSPPSLQPTESAFIHFGYCECLDSFLGFGLFRLAREIEFLPDSLTSLFARVLWEEARHIVFFVNWIAYERVRRGYGSALVQAVATAIGYIRAVIDRILSGREMTKDSPAAGPPDGLQDLSLTRVLAACLEENERLMARFDERLLQPRVIPVIARLALDAAKAGKQVRDVVAPRGA